MKKIFIFSIASLALLVNVLVARSQVNICIGCSPPPPTSNNCANSRLDAFARVSLGVYPSEARERGFSIDCINNGLIIVNERVSTSTDQCVTRLQPTGATVAFAHTHPLFRSDREAVGCRGRTLSDVRSEGGFKRINAGNENFSTADRRTVRSQKKILYLRTPSRRTKACDPPSCPVSGRAI